MEAYILMLQTDADDMYITHSTLQEIGNSTAVKFAADITELQETVKQSGEPAVILLNDRGAVHSGNALLKKLKSDSQLGHIPIVVLGEVSTKEYIKQCYRAGANTYITKPSTIVATRKKIETFFKYWSEVAETGS